ncbi:hypothetical protein OHW09_09780 [Acinetobacter baumannii]|nr:hypothetical protein [Acinetobacter baumannii]MDC4947193.1 hypothetical protein [Acinetobacter baumannii]
MSIKITGNTNGLKQFTKNAEKLDGQQQQVSLGAIFNEGFIQSQTDFESIDDLFAKAGFKVESEEDFAAIPQEAIDAFVKEHTKFNSYTDMYRLAAAEYMSKQLFNGMK